MAQPDKYVPLAIGDKAEKASHKSENRSKRERRVYDHEMNEREKWALSVIHRTQSALKAAAVSLQEGEKVSSKVIEQSLALQQACVGMLFDPVE